MEMPIRRFWLMSGMVSRLRAEEDMRSLSVAVGPHSGTDNLRQLRDQLRLEIDTPVLVTDVMDREGVEKLKRMFGGKK